MVRAKNRVALETIVSGETHPGVWFCVILLRAFMLA